ncbi:hypothetical protein [Paenibacillus polymyxa]|uniref:hypothetical protein n=1 Tax=Paenibacillus polymyxa TaxID=1406 RepID=UPI0013778E38|nr:hypothetical protein [Paenibacillus polymyxa]
MSYGWVKRRCANDLILRSLLQRDALDWINTFKGGHLTAKANADASPDSNPPLRYRPP